MAIEEQVYVELAKHFLGRFVAIGEALASLGGEGLWDPIERSFFDLLRREGRRPSGSRPFRSSGWSRCSRHERSTGLSSKALPEFRTHLDRLALEHQAVEGSSRPAPQGTAATIRAAPARSRGFDG